MKHWILPAILAIFVLLVSPKILKAPPFIKGYVYDATDSTAIDSATVVGECVDAEDWFSTFTNESGYYTVYDMTLAHGNWHVPASHPSYLSQTGTVWLPCSRYINFYLRPRP